jgi:hypothetical protein
MTRGASEETFAGADERDTGDMPLDQDEDLER